MRSAKGRKSGLGNSSGWLAPGSGEHVGLDAKQSQFKLAEAQAKPIARSMHGDRCTYPSAPNTAGVFQPAGEQGNLDTLAGPEVRLRRS